VNRILRFLNPPRQRAAEQLTYAAYLAGKNSARRGQDLAGLILHGWRHWPGSDGDRAELLASASIGWLTESRRAGR
jgi:hypothetical protein